MENMSSLSKVQLVLVLPFMIFLIWLIVFDRTTVSYIDETFELIKIGAITIIFALAIIFIEVIKISIKIDTKEGK